MTARTGDTRPAPVDGAHGDSRRGGRASGGGASGGGADVTGKARAPRRDALRNRARLIATAADAFRADGLEVGVDEIARRADVGIATLYRHFPTKDDLIVAVGSGLIEQLQQLRDDVLASGDPATALERFLREALARQRADRGLVEALARHPPTPAIRSRMRARTLALVEPLVARGHVTGELDPELDAADLLVALRMLGAAARPDVPRDPERYLRVVMRGLRADG